MAYIVPRVLIKQEFSQVPVFADQPLAALVFGPQYDLYRYSVASEKASTKVVNPDDEELTNVYQASVDTTYDFPGQTPGTAVDASFVKVFFEKAQLEYYPSELDNTAGVVSHVAVPNSAKYYPNRFKATTLVFKTANSVDRSDDFSNRNVALGDIVVLESVTDDASFTTKVKALHYSKSSAAVTADATVDTGNTANQTEEYDNTDAPVVAGTDNVDGDVIVTNDSTAFKGGFLASGEFVGIETFTATVVVEGNLTDARFDISSTNGLHTLLSDYTSIATATVSADGDVLVLWQGTGTDRVRLDFTGSTNFVEGNTYSVTVQAPLVKANHPTASGTYTGDTNLVYKLTVVREGPYADGTNGTTCARVSVTSNGLDSSATVSPVAGTNFDVGSYGVVAQFNASTGGAAIGGLLLGDIYYVTATAAAPAATNIIETYDSLPATLVSGATTDWTITSMRLQQDYQVNQAIPDNDVDLNYEIDADAQTITINSGITSAVADILDLSGDPAQLDVKTANIFVEHRDLVDTNGASIGSLNDPSLVDEVLGTIHPDNPIAQGVYDALLNSAGVSVYFCSVLTDDLEGYETVLGLARKSELYYGLVPLTHDRTIQDAVVGHVNAMSTPEKAKWRVAWISAPLTTDELIYDLQADETDYLGTLTDDPLIADSDPATYTLLTVADAEFVTDGVRPGDKVRINFRTDALGVLVWDVFTVDEVRTETTLTVVTGSAAAINVAVKVQIQRVYTKDEQIDTLAQVGSDYNNRRVRAVFPETLKNGTTVKPGYFLAAALAGLRSGVVPHQGLTNTEILGFTDLTQSVKTFSEDQLNRLAEQGYFIAMQDAVGATPYVRHQLTTDSESLNTSEDSVTTNVDSISFGLHRTLRPYIGQYNINRGSLALIRAAVFGELKFRETGTFTARAGNQLNGFEILSLSQNATFKDRVDATVQLEVPYPVNFITITLLV